MSQKTIYFDKAKVIGADFDPKEYHTEPSPRGSLEFVMSRSQLCEFLRCPHRWVNGYESPESKSTEWGTLMDILLLGDEATLAVTPKTYKNEKGEEKDWNWNANVCKAWREEQEAAGLQEVKHSLFAEAGAAMKKLFADPAAKELLLCSQRQVFVTAIYQSKSIEVPVKALIDLVPDKGNENFGKSVADFKTAASADPGGWGRRLFSSDYHVQAAMNLDLYVAATEEDRTDFLHLIQENFFPFEIGKRIVSQEFVELGRQTYRHALDFYAQCLKEKRWPRYDETTRLQWRGWTITDPEPWMISKAIDLPAMRTETREPESEEVTP